MKAKSVLKKGLALSLAIVSALELTACGNSDDSVKTMKKEDITYTTEYNLIEGKPFDGTELNLLACAAGDPQMQSAQDRLGTFKDTTGIGVTWDQGDWGGLLSKMITEGGAKTNSYDIYMAYDAWGTTVRDYLMPLDDFIARDDYNIDDFAPIYQAWAKLGTDKIMGIPYRAHFQIMFYRKDIYEELGLEIPKTWEELIANAKIIEEKKGIKGFACPYGTGYQYNLMDWYAFFFSNGGEFFDADYNVTFNNEAGVKSLEQYTGLLTKEGIVSPDSLSWGEEESCLALGKGEAAMMMGWSWLLSRYSDPDYCDASVVNNIGTFPVPSFDGEHEAITTTTIFIMSIPKNSPNPEAAWEYIKYLCSAEQDKETILDENNDTVITTHRSTMQDADLNVVTDGMLQQGYETLEKAKAIPMIPEYTEISYALEEAVFNCANGADAKTELDKAAEKATSILKEAGYYK